MERGIARIAVVVVTGLLGATLVPAQAGGTRKPVRMAEKLEAGRNVVAIRARLGARKVLAPGRHRVVGTANNKVGTSPKETLRLRVVR